ncbi:MAG: glutamate racemase, partial [Balneola sp.]|nr:glutamate racemase [Balneola sp.]
MQHNRDRPIGIFDSGIGGLTVAKAVKAALPNEDILYFGDTARVPYGVKSEETVRAYALEITKFLMDKGVKMILIACNTVSASAKEDIMHRAGTIPVIDVISAGAQAASESGLGVTPTVGVIGTIATVQSKAYEEALIQQLGSVNVIQQACPLLVPLAEEGWIEHEVARLTVKEYVRSFDDYQLDALILGCTHYPLFTNLIADVLPSKQTQIIDSAESIATSAKQYLVRQGGCNTK